MKEAGTIISFKGSKGRVDLKPEELVFFEELLIHRVMTANAVHDFFQATSSHTRSPSAISNRLKRFLDTGLLIRLQEDISPSGYSIYRYYYKLAKRGLRVLEQVGKLTSEEVERLHLQINKLQIPKRHNIGTSTLANNILLEGMKIGFTNFTHSRGVDGKGFNQKERGAIKSYELVIPDWLFSNYNCTICMEVDTGFQQRRVIESKIARYMKYADSVKESEEEVVLLFSIMDSSLGLSAADVEDRSKRVASLKSCVPPTEVWPSNLSIYVVSSERTVDIVLRLLMGEEPYPADIRSSVILDWYNTLEEYKPIKMVEVENDGRLSEMIVSVMRKGRREKVAILWGEEGSVRTYQQIKTLFDYSQKYKNINAIIVLYQTRGQDEFDVFGKPWNNIWLTNREEWYEFDGEIEDLPKMYRVTSYYRRELSQFE